MLTDTECCSKGTEHNEIISAPKESDLMHIALTLLRLSQRDNQLPILDLACGIGRNGLFLQKYGYSVVYADKDPQSLAQVKQFLTQGDISENSTTIGDAQFWQLDFEQDGEAREQVEQKLCEHAFQAIIVSRYLHRPLMPLIKKAIAPGGCIIYETFTRAQAKIGRPKNPDFLLEKGELAKTFQGWHIKHQFEGVENNQAIAQLMALKP